ncbi:MAG: hypothetical protein K0Q46_3528 [Rhodococcus erythropolis]|nr:hypothetical protein [Rhodococcus erythropolis]
MPLSRYAICVTLCHGYAHEVKDARPSTQPRRARNIARDAVRAHVTAVAIDLFDSHGFENVTIEQIAEAAEISRRSFHRYFAAKEDVVVGDSAPMGELVLAALLQRSPQEPEWISLCESFIHMFATVDADVERGKRTVRIMAGTPSLRARNLEKHLLWAEKLTPAVEQRLTGQHRKLRAQAIVHASLACLDVSLATWAHSSDTNVEDILRQSFAAINAAPS